MKKLDAAVIGKLCMETECGDGIASLDLWDVLPADRGDTVGQMARICGELYEEMEAARDECDAVAKWIEEHIDGARSSSPGLQVTVALLRLLAEFKKRFPAAVAEDPDGFRISDTDGGAP